MTDQDIPNAGTGSNPVNPSGGVLPQPPQNTQSSSAVSTLANTQATPVIASLLEEEEISAKSPTPPMPPAGGMGGVVANATAPSAPQGPFTGDVKKILAGIKLPERFDVTFTGEKKTPSIISQKDLDAVVITETVRPSDKPQPAPTAPITPPASTENAAATPAATMRHDAPLPSPIAPTTSVVMPSAASVETKHATHTMQKDTSAVTPMRTLREDLMHVVRDRKISLVRAVALEEDKKRDTHQPTPKEIALRRQHSRRIFAIVFTIVVLLLLGIAALVGVAAVQGQHSQATPSLDTSSIIFAEQKVTFPLQDLSGGEIKRLLAKARGASNAHLGSITQIVPTIPTTDANGNTVARPATTAEFLQAIGAHVPDDLTHALGSYFFFGIHTIDKNAPLLIIPVTSYDHAFSGMLAWEGGMNTDLAPAFTPVPQFYTDANGISQQRAFQDIVIRNYDARALKDDSGTIELYYSFPTPNLLIIAEDQYSFAEILSRLQVARLL